MSKMKADNYKAATFIELCIVGKVLMDEIDDFISEWHKLKPETPLHEFLGMTWEEYSMWVGDDEILPYIVTAHKDGLKLEDLLEQDYYNFPLAARAGDPFTAKTLMQWLKSHGKLD